MILAQLGHTFEVVQTRQMLLNATMVHRPHDKQDDLMRPTHLHFSKAAASGVLKNYPPHDSLLLRTSFCIIL